MREVEEQISKLKKDAVKFNDLTKPVSAFIMFKEEDAKRLALNVYAPEYTFFGHRLPAKKQIFDDVDVYFEQATEPTNIIWENR